MSAPTPQTEAQLERELSETREQLQQLTATNRHLEQKLDERNRELVEAKETLQKATIIHDKFCVQERDSLRARLQFDPGGGDKIDELESCINLLRAQLEARDREVAALRDVLENVLKLVTYAHGRLWYNIDDDLPGVKERLDGSDEAKSTLARVLAAARSELDKP